MKFNYHTEKKLHSNSIYALNLETNEIEVFYNESEFYSYLSQNYPNLKYKIFDCEEMKKQFKIYTKQSWEMVQGEKQEKEKE